MSDTDTTISDLKKRVDAFASERDWQQFHSPKNLSMALAAEAAELMEHFLWAEHGQDLTLLEHPEKAAQIRDELADIVIYALEFANVTDIDLTEAVFQKMAKNAIKYPVEKARGKSLKYDEL